MKSISRLCTAKKYHDSPTSPAIKTAPSARTIDAGNIGAATIFANYDGAAKHRTTIGADVYTGSDTILVAPVTVGDGAYTAAGSVITEDVPAGALGVARGRQHNSEGWVERRRPGTRAAARARQTREAAGPPDGPALDKDKAAKGG